MSLLAELTADEVSRFLSHVDRSSGPDGCWPWRIHRDPKGYGTMKVRRRNLFAHRIAFTVANDRAPSSSELVLHRCDNPPCCNPRHLFLGTQADNMADMWSKGRGARLSGEQHSRARLTLPDVIEIRRLRAEGWSTPRLAKRFGLNNAYVWRLVRGEYWRESFVAGEAVAS